MVAVAEARAPLISWSALFSSDANRVRPLVLMRTSTMEPEKVLTALMTSACLALCPSAMKLLNAVENSMALVDAFSICESTYGPVAFWLPACMDESSS